MVVSLNPITEESQRLFEKVQRGELRNQWYACSLFITNYGPWGFKFEADAVHYDANGKRDRTDGLNIDGPTVDYFTRKGMDPKAAKSEAYRQTKAKFWAAWKEAHPGEFLLIGKCMTSWGL